MTPLLLAALLAATPPAVSFTSTPRPATDEERCRVLASSTITVETSGRRATWPLDHHVLHHPGDRIGGGTVGLVTDHRGKAVLLSPPDSKGRRARGPFFASSPDANTLVPLRGPVGAPRQLALVTHFEYEPEGPDASGQPDVLDLYGKLPMLLGLTTLRQDSLTGLLDAVDFAQVDAVAARGIWTPCNGSLTPWGTHLGSEEYEPNARYFESAPFEPMNLWLRTPGRTARQGGANPYDYGHVTEVTVHGPGRASLRKHHAMGRLSFELALVMPDERTAYSGDDARDGAQFLFVADRPRDLSSGRLYAARWTQRDGAGFGRATLEWLPMGHATSAEIEALIRSGITFSSLFEVATAEAVAAAPDAHRGFRAVQVYPGTSPDERSRVEWLRPRPGREKAAAFLESRRMAGWLGATTELTKMEGLAHSAARRRLYVALAAVGAGMVAGSNADRPQDHVRLDGDPKDLLCGAVYEAELRGGAVDAAGARIESEWVAVDMKPLLTGAANRGADADVNRCEPDRVAGPDNLDVSESLDVLFIGEDTDFHLNNFLWAVPLGGGEPVRLLSAPVGAEVSGLRAVDDANGFAYVLVNVQHPGSRYELQGLPPELRARFEGRIDTRGSVGYLGPFRAR